MNQLLKIAELAAPALTSSCGAPYGNQDLRRFLRDVMAIANATVEGPRYVTIGLLASGH